jgi:TatD DNase family protein
MIDTHTHLYSKDFDEDREGMIQNAIKAGVSKFLLPNIDLESIDGMNQLVKDYPGQCFAMMGLHPCSVAENYIEVLDKMKTELDNGDYIAVGEIGVDLFWDKTFKSQQIEAFIIQIEWAKSRQIPIVIHVRDAFDEVFEVIDELNDETLTGIFHCFTGNIEQANKVINYGGFKIGLGGVLTFKNSGLDKVVADIDMSHLVIETDAPYLAPNPHRGKRNESAYVELVAQKLADIKSIDLQSVIDMTTSNANEVFNLGS